MNLVEIFEEFMDSLFWEGFTEDIRKNDPTRYEFELSEFIKLYK